MRDVSARLVIVAALAVAVLLSAPTILPAQALPPNISLDECPVDPTQCAGLTVHGEASSSAAPPRTAACVPPFTSIVPDDSDCDGAPDAAEEGDDPFACGTRDPNDPWDFYTVPAPTLHSGGTMDSRDTAVSIPNDVLAMLEYSGTRENGPPNGARRDYDDDLDGDTVKDGVAYDRSVGATWSGPPDGAITILADVLLVLAQVGHSCPP